MVHSNAYRRMWSTTFRGAFECGYMFITEITLNKIIRYNVELLASRCFFYYFQHSLFEHFKRHDLQFKLYFCITMYTVVVFCLGCCYGGYFPGRLSQYWFIFKINNQFQPDILFEVSIILKDMYIISIVLCYSLIVIHSTFLDHDDRRFKFYQQPKLFV